MTSKWTNSETKRLLNYVAKGYTHSQIASYLNRTEKAVELKVRRIKRNTLKPVTLRTILTSTSGIEVVW